MNTTTTFGLAALAALIIIPLGVLFAGFLLTNTSLGLSAPDREFISKLEQRVHNPGDRVKLAEVHPGSWTQACIIIGYETPSRVAAASLDVDESELTFINSGDVLASDDLWGFAFLYPPASVEYRQVHSGHFFNGDSTGCIDRADAFVEVLDVRKSETNRLQLIKQ